MLGKLRKIQKLIFMGYVISMPFIHVSTLFYTPFSNNSIPNHMFFLAMLTLIYEYFKFGLKIPKKIKWYLIFFFCWCVVCLIHGLVCYKYNDTLKVATDMSARLRWFVATFPNFFGGFSDETTFMKLFKFHSGIKGIILTILQMPLMLLYIFHIYDNNFDEALSDVTKSCWVLAIAMVVHSFFELSFLWFGANWGKNYLLALNHWIYETPVADNWWPPHLTYGDQLRSLCVEPSYFGHIVTMILPALFLSFTKIKKIYARFIFLCYWTILTVLVIATKSRVTNLIFVIFLLLTLLSTFTVRKWHFTTCVVSVLFVSFLTFYGIASSGIIYASPEHPYTFGNTHTQHAKDYLADNLLNLFTTDLNSSRPHVGSNNTRWGSGYAGMLIISMYPIFGVGYGLEAHYIADNLPAFTKNNQEIQNCWHNRKLENGKTAFIGMVHFTILLIMVQCGILAGILWLLPIIFFAPQFFSNVRFCVKQENYVFIFIMLVLNLLVVLFTDYLLYSIPMALLFLYHAQMKQQQILEIA